MIAVIRTPFSNTTSVTAALDRLGLKNFCVDLPQEISDETTHLILPGVGHAGALLKHLRTLNWDSFIQKTQLPFLGICLGFQILFDYLEEGELQGLGIMEGKVVKLPLTPLPHIGWSREKGSEEYFYFVHSFGVLASMQGTHELEGKLPVVTRARKRNFFGTQFHPERSGKCGEKILQEYLCS